MWLQVSLLSGDAVRICVEPQDTVGDLRRKAQRHLGGLECLLDTSGVLLEGRLASSVEGPVTAVTRRPLLCSSRGSLAFALRREDGSVKVWGHESCGGAGGVQDEDVDQVVPWPHCPAAASEVCNNFAMAALLTSGGVVCWGVEHLGGDCRAVAHELQEVRYLVATEDAFGALRADGAAICWGAVDSMVEGLKKVGHGL